jgi:hypothetical protein
MKDLKQYLTEASDNFKRFKIDDLMKELEINKVSKSRRNEIVNFYKKILGDGPYYCVSRENEDRKSIKIISNIDKQGYWSVDNYNDLPDNKEWKNIVDGYIQQEKDWNDFVDSLSDDLKKKFSDLSAIKGVRLPNGAFKFGYRGSETYLEGCIVYIDGDFVPCIKQGMSRIRNRNEFYDSDPVFYFAEKDIK